MAQIVLCTEKNNAVVRMNLPEDNQQLLAARHQHHILGARPTHALSPGRDRSELDPRLNWSF